MSKFALMNWCLILGGLGLSTTRQRSCSLRQYTGYVRETRAILVAVTQGSLGGLSIVILLSPYEDEGGNWKQSAVPFLTSFKLLVDSLGTLTAEDGSTPTAMRSEAFEFEFVRGSKKGELSFTNKKE